MKLGIAGAGKIVNTLFTFIHEIQRFEKQPDSNDWDKEMFESAYADTLSLYNISFEDEIRRHL